MKHLPAPRTAWRRLAVDVVRVVVAEDDLLIRELIAALIDARRDLDLVGQAGTGADGRAS